MKLDPLTVACIVCKQPIGQQCCSMLHSGAQRRGPHAARMYDAREKEKPSEQLSDG